MQSNATFNICIAKSCFYIASFNNYIFRPLYRPSSVYTTRLSHMEVINPIATFFYVHGSVHCNNILVYNPNKMHKSQSVFNLTTALHISGFTITRLQEHKTTVTTASGNRYTVLLSAAELELRTFHDSSRQQYGVTVTRCCSYSCFVLLEMVDSDARNM